MGLRIKSITISLSRSYCGVISIILMNLFGIFVLSSLTNRKYQFKSFFLKWFQIISRSIMLKKVKPRDPEYINSKKINCFTLIQAAWKMLKSQFSDMHVSEPSISPNFFGEYKICYYFAFHVLSTLAK
jgi:hypothetical protein